ncbi:phage minor structural protein, n-terminal [Heliomicrobium modesticaldum Ice1]|uniref:Phage minor structural protein, n-terminal n=1 Tax=Heliobacterium modesticaldum (strain ATCC 51547 / Ice1) TaxID=498761 RepID=B0TDF5_HELMI|nr:phage tail protein [Heliomicrobium modesticaldum]ABZ85480.1 phage minor structural protein, n-terminal [Heliomicrobium modesticaldum Ice1]
MAVKSVLTNQTDFTGEIPVTKNTSALWRFNEPQPDGNMQLADSSGNGRHLTVSGWSGTTASLISGRFGRYFRMNINNPATEKTHLVAANDGTFFSDLGDKIAVGGWINPTTYSVGQTYVPLFNTRQGPGQPLFYLSLYQGRPRMMLYNSAGTLILDQSETPSFTMVNGGWYFIAAVIEVTAKTSQIILCNRADGTVWVAPKRAFTGTPNPSCIADIVLGMHANQYYFAGGFDDWFLEVGSELTIEDLRRYFQQAMLGNGGDTNSAVDAITEPGAVTLKKGADNNYPASGVLTTIAAQCSLAGSGRVSVASEYAAGITAVSLVETSTSDDLADWSAWQAVGTNGELASPNREYICYRITLSTNDAARTPKLLDITLHDIPKAPYERLGFSRPVVLDANGAWEAVLENAYDIIATGEVNGADTLDFKFPYNDPKRASLDNEKQVQIAGDIYRIRTLTDEKGSDGSGILTTVYAEAAFYDLTFSAEKQPVEFNADLPSAPMRYALEGTSWSLGTVDVTTLRTWQCNEKNALAILRRVQQLHGGDLVFDSRNRLVSLLAFSGRDNGALFAYRKNLTGIKRVVDTRSLVTRLYAFGKDGMTFSSINGGKEYVEDYTYSNEVRVSTLDCPNFTNPYQMLEFANMRLAEYARPRVSYVLSAMDLSVLTGYEHEQWSLGDIVTVDDRDLNLSIKTRIVRRQYNLQEPWKTVLELSSKLRELGDSPTDAFADQLGQSNLIGQEIKDMVPFNHLRNSRADDGFAYWQNSGFEVDTENGLTGTASFKATGSLGATKSMAQTVYPASRRSYTISAQIGSDNLQKGANGQVGIELVFEYEDGTTETRFIDLL